MKKTIYLFLAVVFLASCGGKHSTTGESRKASGGVYYGGVFRMNEIEDFRNLFPLNVTEVTSQRITNQVYEGLVKLSQTDLAILPSLAEKWVRNADATQWTFTIRKGVKFGIITCLHHFFQLIVQGGVPRLGSISNITICEPDWQI